MTEVPASIVDKTIVLQLSAERLVIGLVWEVLWQEALLEGSEVMNLETSSAWSPRDDAGLTIYVGVADVLQDSMEAKGKRARRRHAFSIANLFCSYCVQL